MFNIAVPYIIIGFFTLFAAAIGISLWLEKKRREELKRQASRLGFSFIPKDDGTAIGNFNNFPIFDKGHSRCAYNIMRGNQRDNDWTIFDYRYTVGSGKNQTTYCQTIAAITLQNFNFPSFMLLPENFFYKIADFVGYKDIDFSDKPLFSKNYFLKGPDETAIRNLFSREIMSFFERENYKGHLEANDRYILIYTPGRRIEPQNFRQFLENSGKIIRAFTGK